MRFFVLKTKQKIYNSLYHLPRGDSEFTLVKLELVGLNIWTQLSSRLALFKFVSLEQIDKQSVYCSPLVGWAHCCGQMSCC